MLSSSAQQLDYDWTPNEFRLLKHCLEQDLFLFWRYFFKVRTGQRAILSKHHKIIAKTLMRVAAGEITRLIINIPPGFTKTELAVIAFISWGFARNPRSRWIHTSCADDLILYNSSEIKRVVTSPEFQTLWPMEIRQDRKAASLWFNEFGGGMRVAPSGGTLTGFRAGQMEPGFSGGIVIDDPIKPEDVLSDTIRNRINRRITNTIKSRLALERQTPIVLIMQRLHDDDPAGFLLSGGSGDEWHHLEMPVEIEGDEQDHYPSEWISGKPIDYTYRPGPLWRYKIDDEDIKTLKKDIYTYSSQYLQRPAPDGGSIFKRSWFEYFAEYWPVENVVVLPDGERVSIEYKHIYADTAMKTKEVNDFSVFQCWGKGTDGRIYLLDQVRGKWEAPELERKFIQFCDRHEFEQKRNHMGARARRVEDKSSGTGLVQAINSKRGSGYIEGIPRDKDKVSRAKSGAPRIAQGQIVLLESAYWLDEYLYEFEKFTPTMTHKHDDQIDPTLDAIHEMLITEPFVGYKAIQGKRKNG
ncbi:phage terminase large subunit [candidate division KSB1 bacterium]|nr:phage terminase large subunit [candidate division KSB1 bacterium]